jgi:hypothetical protein
MKARQLRVADVVQWIAAGRPDAQVVAEIEAAAGDPYVMRPDGEDRRQFDRATALPPTVRGALGYYLFGHAAESWNNGSGAEREYCNGLLELDHVRQYVFDRYAIPFDHQCDKLALHRLGTTSYLLACLEPRRGLLFKVLKQRYLSNPTITQATEKLRGTRSENRLLPFVPFIVEASDRFVLMEFVEGNTLREEAQKRRTRGKEEYVIWIGSMLAQLCRHLQVLHERRTPHLDLSPDNILIDLSQQMVLIDFGRNYLLLDSVGTPSAILRAQRYVAPEMRESSSQDDGVADLYSLGVIVLEALELTERQPREVIEQQIEHVRTRYAPLALALEALTDTNPNSRVFEQMQRGRPYEEVHAALSVHLTAYREVYRSRDWVDRVIDVAEKIWPSLDRLLEASRQLRQDGTGEFNVNARRLRRWAAWCQVMHLLMLLSFAQAWTGRRFDDLPPSQAWPGLFVAISFAFLATKFYANIFADVTAASLSPLTEWFMRAISWIHVPPILWAMLVNPRDWPFCSALGVLVGATNNGVAFSLARRAQAEIEQSRLGIRLPLTHEAFIKEYRDWSVLMAVYGVVLLGIGLLLRAGVLADEGAYAIAVVILNAVIFWRNCTTHASTVRSGLLWCFDNMRRARAYAKPRADLSRPAEGIAPQPV